MGITDGERKALNDAMMAQELALLAAREAELQVERLAVPVMYRLGITREQLHEAVFASEPAQEPAPE
ncbi:MAG: hypothetical protein ACPHCN_14380 [Mycobacterium sp.]